MIETSAALPKWVTPASAKNRVFLYQGKLHLLPLSVHGTTTSSAQLTSVREAVEYLGHCPDDTASDSSAAVAGMRSLLAKRLHGMPTSVLTSGMHKVDPKPHTHRKSLLAK